MVRVPRSVSERAGLIAGTTPLFNESVTTLLHQRLRMGTLVGAGVLTLGFFTVLFLPGLFVRSGVLAVVIACHLLLRFWQLPNQLQLRLLEVAFLIAFAVQALYMPDVLILESARAGDAATAVMDRQFNIGAWALFVVLYGVFIPNTWQRAACVLIPFSCLPELNFYLLGLYDPLVAKAFAAPAHGPPLPLTLVAAAIGTYGAQALYSIRQDAFRAKQLGQYRLKEKLGSGGMGEVYRAEHKMLKRPCAIKLIRPDVDANAETVARFEREVQITAQLSHWNTVEIYDYGRTDDGVFYFVMELLPGKSLAEIVEQHGPLPAERAVYLLRQVCAALHEAHSLGLIHRDIKPANIFVSQRGGVHDIVKLLDFGLVKMRENKGDATLTQEGMVSGTPSYMSPEQAAAGDVGPWSDLYSLGSVAYHMVTGEPPFSGPSAFEVMMANARDPVVPPSLRNPSLPMDLEQIILRCLNKKAADRYPDVIALERALAGCDCATGWNAERAAEWWRTRADEQVPDPKPTDDTPTLARAGG
jgi:serine/threonine-protein kinase